MEIKLPAGKYVVAVSGGVDSMALLDMLAKKPRFELIVAHFNHNMRPDSDQDEQLVSDITSQMGLIMVHGQVAPGVLKSENAAREARYKFLKSVQLKHRADMIITAHHQDDLIETALLNVIRGTGRKGLSAISQNPNILRPLLSVEKRQIIKYAQANNLIWQEDPTNQSQDYLRNYLRLNVIPRLTSQAKQNLISNLDKVAELNQFIDINIATISQHIYQKGEVKRREFTDLPNDLGKEVLAYWLRQHKSGEFDKHTLERVSMAIKTAKAGTIQPIKGGQYLEICQHTAHFSNTLQKG